MSTIDELHPASFKGVPFLVDSSTVVGGIKNVKHSFPNSNKQSIESLGLNPDSFDVSATIAADVEGNLYFERRNKLLLALKDGTSGILVHPFYGQINNIKATSFSIEESMSSIGKCSINIVFELDDTTGLPNVDANTLPIISNQAGIILETIAKDISSNFSVSNKYPSNFTNAIDVVNSIIETFNKNTSFLSVSADKINTFSSEVSYLAENIASLVSNPVQLADGITGLFDTVNGLYATVDSTFEVLTKFFTFGEDITRADNTTVSRVERNRNNDLLDGMMQAESLVLAYDNAVQMSFLTIDQVSTVENILEKQYQQVFSNKHLSSSALGLITDYRSLVQEFFNKEKLNTRRIIGIRTNIIPSAVLAYQYYGSTELASNLAGLNTDLNTSFLEGTLEIITS